jgi:hypothetical protein
MKAFAVTLVILASVNCVHAQKVIGVDIVEYGVFQKIASQDLLNAPQVLDGKINGVIEGKLIESTTTIKASVGTSFGIRVKILGEPEGQVIACGFRWLHPKMTDPVSGQSSESDQWESQSRIGHPRYTGYTFDSEWELVPGEWTLQVLYGGRVLAEKKFSVIVTPFI